VVAVIVMVVMAVMMMTTMTIIPAMVMVMVMVVVVMVPVLRKYLVRVSLGLRLGARCVHRVSGHQHGDRIRDWLEQLRIRPGVQDFSHVLRPHRFHRGRRCKGGDCAHKARDLLDHFDLPEKFMRVCKNHALSQLAH
jgi:hypothetical protein